MKSQRITTLAENGRSPEAAACLYVGEVMHARLKPFGHRFVYRVFSLLIDLDRLSEAGRLSRLFGVNRKALVSFRESDHTGPQDTSARGFADRLFAEAGMERPARILLLCYPRILGYVFNPISVYFAYDEAGALTGLIYSVRNTFGERHQYVAPLAPGELNEAGVRQERTKLMHVSPFISMQARYFFRILPPGRTVRLRIHETEGTEPVLSATFVGEQKTLDGATLTANLLRIPLMTWKVTAGIHWEALKLWLKGATFHKSPPSPRPASYRDEPAALEPGE
jgi:uncharacterized protein